ncbi:MAG: hypothetical protein H6739_18760 [Alphaproteobacteria bacterium]|nr:hypothetical protein [Alphaproteobacteria bacterium]
MRALWTALLALGCAEEPAPEVFEVVSSMPEDGAADVPEALAPELRVSGEADPVTCTPDTLGLGALAAHGGLAFEVGLSVTLKDEGRKIVLAPDEPLPQGFTYAYLVRAGSDACSDTLGRSLGPFYAEFTVP